jgi:hypothetical protein
MRCEEEANALASILLHSQEGFLPIVEKKTLLVVPHSSLSAFTEPKPLSGEALTDRFP